MSSVGIREYMVGAVGVLSGLVCPVEFNINRELAVVNHKFVICENISRALLLACG